MKSVLLSVQPKWCKKIINIIGQKDKKPIYEKTIEVRTTMPNTDIPFKVYIYETKKPTFIDEDGHEKYQGRGKVICEFICRGITIFEAKNDTYYIPDFILNKTCLTEKELWQYGKGKELKFWDISDLVIYDKPKELSDFIVERYPCLARLKRPPQSWCYVEGVEE